MPSKKVGAEEKIGHEAEHLQARRQMPAELDDSLENFANRARSKMPL